MSTRFRPLRQAVSLHTLPGEATCRVELRDEELELRLELDGTTASVARALDQERALPELARMTGLDDARVCRAVELLARSFLLDDEAGREAVADARAARAWQATPAAEIPLLLPPGARFTCTGCGSCCGFQSIGPVQPEVLEAAWHEREALQRETRGAGMFVSVDTGTGRSDPPPVLCRLQDGVCVFLAADDRCILHREHGEKAKPACCRVFPLRFVATPQGVAVSMLNECRGFVQARKGQPLAEQQDALRSLIPLVPSLRRVRPVIRLDERHSLTFSAYSKLEAELHRTVASERGGPAAVLLAMRSLLERARGRDPAARAPGSDLTTLRRKLAALIQGLQRSIDELDRRFRRADAQLVVHTDSLLLLGSALRRLPSAMQVLVEPLADHEQHELFCALVHHELAGKRLADAPTLTHGLARLVFTWLASRALALDRARGTKRRHLGAQDVQDGIVLVHFMFHDRDFAAELQSHDEALHGLFYDRLPALVRRAAALPEPETRMHIYKY